MAQAAQMRITMGGGPAAVLTAVGVVQSEEAEAVLAALDRLDGGGSILLCAELGEEERAADADDPQRWKQQAL